MGFIKRAFFDRLWLSLVGVIVVFIMAIAYMFAAVLDTPLTERPINLDVELEQTGGLFEGSAVTYRGVKVGKVNSVTPRDGGGVLAQVRLSAGTEVPTDSIARVRSLSPVGEQYLDFQPNTPSEPFFKNGDVISAESTDLPNGLHETFVAVNSVLEQIDDKKLRIVLQELSTGLAGTGDDLGLMVDQGEELLATLNEIWPETRRVINNADTVLDIGTDNAGSLRQFGTSAKQLAAFLADYSTEFKGVLAKTPGNLASLEEVVVDAGEIFPEYLATGAAFSSMFRPWNPHFRALLQEYPRGIAAVSEILSGGSLSMHLVTANTARCDYGTTRHASEQAGTSFQTEGRCPASFGRLQRGAAHAPGPVG